MANASIAWAVVVLMICLVGCVDQPGGSTSQAELPAGYVQPASTDNLPLVDHPEYVAWSRFAVGEGVVRKKEVTNEFGVVHVTTTVRLAEKTKDRVVVQSQVTVQRDGESPTENAPQNAEFAARFRLPSGMTVEQFTLPSLKAKQLDDETLSLAGREYQAQVFTWQEFSERGPMTIQLWRSVDVPGRMLRQHITGPQHQSREEVVEVTNSSLKPVPGDAGEKH